MAKRAKPSLTNEPVKAVRVPSGSKPTQRPTITIAEAETQSVIRPVSGPLAKAPHISAAMAKTASVSSGAMTARSWASMGASRQFCASVVAALASAVW